LEAAVHRKGFGQRIEYASIGMEWTPNRFDRPPDATIDDAIEQLVFLAKVEAGLAELDRSEGIPHDEAKRRLGL
jgi:hypothetical protein